MLYVVKLEPNKPFLRALMTSYFESSPNAYSLLDQALLWSLSPDERKKSYFNQIWAKAAKYGPVSSDKIAEIEQQACQRLASEDNLGCSVLAHWMKAAEHGPPHPEEVRKMIEKGHEREAANARGLFFANLIEFVRNLRIPDKKFAPLPDTADSRMLVAAAKSSLGKLVDNLREKEIQALILSEFTPDKMNPQRPEKPEQVVVKPEAAPQPAPRVLPPEFDVPVSLPLPRETDLTIPVAVPGAEPVRAPLLH